MKKEIELGGRTISFDTTTFAQQATASVMVRSGDTMVLTSAVFGNELAMQRDFLPLTVEYREHISSSGKIPGGFFKREGRNSEKETVTCRLIDRSVRPLFPKTFNREIQVVSFVYSFDPEVDPDMLAILGASATVALSPFPAQGPVAAVRVSLVEGIFIVNPTITQTAASELTLVISAGTESLLMLEGIGKNVPEEKVMEGIALGFSEAQKLAAFIKENFSGPKVAFPEPEQTTCDAAVKAVFDAKFSQVSNYPGKKERNVFFDEIHQEILAGFPEADDNLKKEIKGVFEKELRARVRNQINQTKIRLDGRKPNEVRKITCAVGLLPRVHGSALFHRGETQSLVLITLGTWGDEQRIEGLLEESKKRFLLHYNFPSFSVGECRPMRGPGRREIGHGLLAEKSLINSLPSGDDFPYTIRIVSDILESNGSSSMATVCASSLGLMDAGVPMKNTIGGVALGLIKEGDDFTILTDIAGEEDHYGDLDLKIAGTTEGITALQMDVKTTQLSLEILRQAFLQSREGRTKILEVMNQTLPAPRPTLSEHAPKISLIKIPVEKIGAVIGPGGKNIRKIIEETGADVEINDDGGVQIISRDEASRAKATAIIKGMTEEPTIGQVYSNVKVTRILPFGAMVEYLPRQEGLVHVSELDHRYVGRVEDVVNIGDIINVKIVGVDEQHRVNLSRKALLPPPPPGEEGSRPPSVNRGDRSGRPGSGRPQPRLTHRGHRSGPNK
ncbi:MAG: polyribonucleotide nucleotidyltransferase [Candidatus Omnitrophota bacterium]